MIITSIIILVFLTILVTIKLEVPAVNKIEEKLYTFYDLYMAYQQGTLYLMTILPYVITSFIMIIIVLLSIYISKKQENPLITAVVLAGLLTQGVMVMAPYSPLRTTLTPILFFWLGIAYLVSLGSEREYSIIGAFIIAFAIQNINLAVVLLIVYMGIKNIKLNNNDTMKEVLSIFLMLLIIASSNWYQIYAGYKNNKEIFNENIERIEQFIENNPSQEEQENKEIQILLPKDDRYGFTAMAGVDWIDAGIKGYFGINKLVTFIGVNPD